MNVAFLYTTGLLLCCLVWWACNCLEDISECDIRVWKKLVLYEYMYICVVCIYMSINQYFRCTRRSCV